MKKEVSNKSALNLKGALMIYENHYAEYRPIVNSVFLAAEPLKRKTLEKISEGFYEKETKIEFDSIIPEKCIKVKHTPLATVIWREKERAQNLMFSDSKNDGSYFVPNLIFKIKGNNLFVWAYKEWKKEDTLLYQVRFPNTSGNGDICLGSVEMKTNNLNSWEELMQEGYRCFFYTKFTHKIENTALENQKNKKEFNYEYYTKETGKLRDVL